MGPFVNDGREPARTVVSVERPTEDRDAIIHTFAPFHRLGPARPRLPDVTDVLTEGVNLQGAVLLINYVRGWACSTAVWRASTAGSASACSLNHLPNLIDRRDQARSPMRHLVAVRAQRHEILRWVWLPRATRD